LHKRVKKFAASFMAACLPFTSALSTDAIPSIHPQAVEEAVPLALKALEIQQAAMEREERRRLELARRGIAELPPSPAERHTLDIAGFGAFAFDEWGEFYIDRRFVTDEEMHTVRAIERWFAKWFPEKAARRPTGTTATNTQIKYCAGPRIPRGSSRSESNSQNKT
jgi:hypothetical protein